MVSSVNKYKISLEPAKHVNDRVVKLLHQTEEECERNTENRTWRSKIKSNGIIVSQSYPIMGYYKFLHDKNNQSDCNYNFCMAETASQITITGFCTHLTHAIMD